MRRPIVIGAIAAGAVGLGLLTTPVLADTLSGDDTTTTVGRGFGQAAASMETVGICGDKRGRPWNGTVATDPADRPCLDGATYTSGTLTKEQQTELAGMAEDEKLAHDVYVVLATHTGDDRFSRIAAAEERHLSTVRILLDRYGVDDPTEGRAAGEFATSEVQTLYEDLVTEGKTSLTAALTVGRKIEMLDIADLDAAAKGVDAPDIAAAYSNLRRGSERHLAAFGG